MKSTEAHLRATYKYRNKNRSKYAFWQRERRKKSLEKFRKSRMDYYRRNIEKERESCRLYHAKNKLKIAARKKAKNSSPEGRERSNSYQKNRRKSNPQAAMALRVRSIVSHAVKVYGTGKKPCSTQILCGCSWVQLCEHIESKFKPGMTWMNQGKWHIDHIIPLCAFDLTNSDQLFRALHFTNLQPLWAEDNWKKGPRRKCEYDAN